MVKEAMRFELEKLGIIHRFLLWTGTADSDTVIRIGNEQRNLLMMANILEVESQKNA